MSKAGKPKFAAKGGGKLKLEPSFATWLGVGPLEVAAAGSSGKAKTTTVLREKTTAALTAGAVPAQLTTATAQLPPDTAGGLPAIPQRKQQLTANPAQGSRIFGASASGSKRTGAGVLAGKHQTATASGSTPPDVAEKPVAPQPGLPSRPLPAIVKVGTEQLQQTILSKQRRGETVFITASRMNEAAADTAINLPPVAAKAGLSAVPGRGALPERFAEALGVFSGQSQPQLSAKAMAPLLAKAAAEHGSVARQAPPATAGNTAPSTGTKPQKAVKEVSVADSAATAVKAKTSITTNIDPVKGLVGGNTRPTVETAGKMPQKNTHPKDAAPVAQQGGIVAPKNTPGNPVVVLGDDETRFEQQEPAVTARLSAEINRVFAEADSTVIIAEPAQVVATGAEFTHRRSLFKLLPQNRLTQEAVPVDLQDLNTHEVEPDATIWLEAEQHDETEMFNMLDPQRSGSGASGAHVQIRSTGERPPQVQNKPVHRQPEAGAIRPDSRQKIVAAATRSNQNHNAAAEGEQPASGKGPAAAAVPAADKPFGQPAPQRIAGTGDAAQSRAVPLNALSGINLNPQGSPIPGMLQPAVRHVVYLFRFIGEHLETRSHFRVDAGKLGMLEIRVVEEAEGRSIMILTDGEESRNLLQKSLPLIRQTLSESNIPYAQVSVDIGSTADRSQEQLARQQQHGQTGTSDGSLEGEPGEQVSVEATRYYGYNNWEITV